MDEENDEFLDCRFSPFRFSSTFMRSPEWGVLDHIYVPAQPILNWTEKGHRKKPWRNTRANAEDLARILNRNHENVDFVTKGTLSLTQLIHYANLHRDNTATVQRVHAAQGSKRPATPKVTRPKFFICSECGKAVKGDHVCH